MLPSFEFWTKEQRLLWKAMTPFFIALIHAGGEAGVGLLPESIRILMNWDVFNQDAIAYLREYRLAWVEGISETTRTQSVEAISEWIASGESKPVLDTRLTQILGPARAKRIATTEVTRMYAKGNKLAWQSTGFVTEQKWQTAQDERVCPICGPLHDRTVSIEEAFFNSPEDIANSPQMKELVKDPDKRMARAASIIRSSGAFIEGPPAHPSCRCWLLPVVSEEGLERELEKTGLKAEVAQIISDLHKDKRVVMEA